MAGNALDAHDLPAKAGSVRSIVFHGSADSTVHPSNGAAIARRALAGTAESVQTTAKGETGADDSRASCPAMRTAPRGSNTG